MPVHLTRSRFLVLLIVVILLTPTAVSGAAHYFGPNSESAPSTSNASVVGGNTTANGTGNIAFVSTQGKETRVGSRLVAVNTTTKQPLWTHTSFCRYYDVDPLNRSTLLVSADTEGCLKGSGFEALIIDWRNDTVLDRFPLPPDTHDVDSLGGGEYAVADKKNDRIYVYNLTHDRITWQYRFKPRFPRSAGGGPADYSHDYTHLNDIDTIDNGSAFLVSPRNFDRVMAIEYPSKQLRWVLGEQDNKTTLNKQHNPVLLSRDPLEVLVADSENDRVIEYTRTDGKWRQSWVYVQNLDWPRDADRLPDGNTLIVDTYNQRVLEITPEKQVVWRYQVEGFAPYDVERLRYGDEPAGPSITALARNGSASTNSATDTNTSTVSGAPSAGARARSKNDLIGRTVEVYDEWYTTAQWVVPSWVGRIEFGLAILAIVVVIGWSVAEALFAVGRRTTMRLS